MYLINTIEIKLPYNAQDKIKCHMEYRERSESTTQKYMNIRINNYLRNSILNTYS